MKLNWRTNRVTIFFLFIITAFYTLFNPKPALNILRYYEEGLYNDLEKKAMDDL